MFHCWRLAAVFQVRCFLPKHYAVFHCYNYFDVDLIAAVYVYKLFHKHFLQHT